MNKYNNSNRGYKSTGHSKSNKNPRSNTKRKNKNKISSVIVTVLVVFALLACLGGLVHLFRNNSSNSIATVSKNQVIYFVPGDDWSADESSYGAWCWNESSMPASKFILGTDDNADGIFEFVIPTDYSSLLFVDLKPGTAQLGLNWENVRAQTTDLVLPTDEKNYYHQYANEWSATSDMLFNVTTEEKNVYLDCADWSCGVNPVVYCFDKTGKAEATYVTMTQCGSSQYVATIPAGYTHIIFINFDTEEAVGTWDNIINQTSDLIIPTGEANHYNTETSEWFVPVAE